MNPLLNSQKPNQALTSVKQMMQMVNTAANPQAAFEKLASNNPAVANVLKLCQGRDPKEVFYSECQRLGVNPDDILNQLR